MKQNINVIGAGFSGLVLSYYLDRAGFAVRLFEASDRVGGLLKSPKTDFGIVEQAANGFIATPDLLQLCKVASIELVKPSDLSKKKYLFFNNKKMRWPFSFFESACLIAKLISFKFKKNKFKPKPFESLRGWGERSFGKKVVDALIEPAFLGVYATRAENLSASLVTKNLFKEKVKKKSVKVKRQTVSVKDGMQGFCESLTDYLVKQGVELNLNCSVSELDLNATNILTCNPVAASDLLSDVKEVKQGLCDINRVSLAKAACFTKELPSDGFGCLFSRNEQIKSLGVLFDSNIFPQRYPSQKLQTWILGAQFCKSEGDVLTQVKKDMLHFWQSKHELSLTDVKIWQETLPLYDIELERFLSKYNTIDPVFEKNYLFANYCGDIGLSQILSKAQKLTERLKL